MRSTRPARAALRLAAGYFALSVAWILLSDRLASRLAFGNEEAERYLQSVKGLGFVALTSGVLFFVALRYLRRAEDTTVRLRLAYDETLAGWASALDIRDRSTSEHTERVTSRTVELARRFGFEGRALDDVRRGATLHDIGKMGVPDDILGKKGPLTDDEWVVMRRHPELAVQMLQGIDYLRAALAIPRCHHEKWDGTGYPAGLVRDQIPIEARLFAVVDVYDAITSVRPYRHPMSPEEARGTVLDGAGTHFDPAVVEAFLELLEAEDELEQGRGPATPQ
jgi:HD-GYP domain-containing protein (c-di-GMP phosphodiesterase class II)